MPGIDHDPEDFDDAPDPLELHCEECGAFPNEECNESCSHAVPLFPCVQCMTPHREALEEYCPTCRAERRGER